MVQNQVRLDRVRQRQALFLCSGSTNAPLAKIRLQVAVGLVVTRQELPELLELANRRSRAVARLERRNDPVKRVRVVQLLCRDGSSRKSCGVTLQGLHQQRRFLLRVQVIVRHLPVGQTALPHLETCTCGTAELQRRLRLLRHHPASSGSGGCLLLLVLHHLNQLLILLQELRDHGSVNLRRGRTRHGRCGWRGFVSTLL